MKLFLDLCKMCKAKLLYEAFLIYKKKNLIKIAFYWSFLSQEYNFR